MFGGHVKESEKKRNTKPKKIITKPSHTEKYIYKNINSCLLQPKGQIYGQNIGRLYAKKSEKL